MQQPSPTSSTSSPSAKPCTTPCSPPPRPTLMTTTKHPSKSPRPPEHESSSKKPSTLDQYLDIIGTMYYKPAPNVLNPSEIDGLVPLEHPTLLGTLRSPIRKPHILDQWTPYEIACFEAGICVYGKHFHQLQSLLPSKTTKQIVEFYYFWKKSRHYRLWKQSYTPTTSTATSAEPTDASPQD